MIVERLALGVELLDARRSLERGVDAIVNQARSVAERTALLAKRRIDPATTVRVLATAADAPEVRSRPMGGERAGGP
ncbi:hypothetical protein ACFUVQ_00170 [Streptomyces rochei]|uniref:hypothetical protein n=1 Tax=Streptomyces rochei TaxID=1928 RepID=UPI0036319F65